MEVVKTEMHINPWKRICDVKINIHDDHQFSQSASEVAAAAATAAAQAAQMEWNPSEREFQVVWLELWWWYEMTTKHL